ncbi:TetR/AcrR family transcriptional regulator [Nocardia sp. FBN12]|uniref:TetR/AcrR family transcriptional regulator n=1 Tax=Nocardia sp. FBN12 TaxID=3419766 RepID=UPI003CFFF9BB
MDRAVDQAMEVFWANGYAGTTPKRLTAELGIGSGSLYNAFESKRALFERTLRRYYERESVRLIQVLDGPGAPRERLRAAVDLVVDAARSDDGRGCMAANAAIEFGGRDQVVEHLVRRIFDRQEAAFRSTIEEGQRSGEIAADVDAVAVAGLFLATINGIRVLAKADQSSPRLDIMAATALRAL